MRPVKVFMVDDSAVILGIVGRLLKNKYQIEIVGTARNGREALERIPAANPDVVVLDVEMPVLDGLRTLEELMRVKPLPVVMLSAHTRAGSKATIDALALGAVDFVPKPAVPSQLAGMLDELAEKINVAAGTPAVSVASVVPTRPGLMKGTRIVTRQVEAVVIGCSTGGPAALRVILPFLPKDLGVPVVVVQHMPKGFTAALADHMGQICSMDVKHAENGELLRPGLILVAPAGLEFRLRRDGTRVRALVQASDVPLAPGGFRPSVDTVMKDFATVYAARTLGVLLTGMGRDGAEGMRAIKKAGGHTIAQDRETCVVYGMPKAAVDAKAVDHVFPLSEIAGQITLLV